ncbi:hypothetical protein M3Y97_00441900 [Aphelenchoides bicaudatus]|nr:hypothetical protein M3Y97_00441900 [Aphelenchoides bicaudatus]
MSEPSSSKDCLVRFSFRNGDEELQMEPGLEQLSAMVAKKIADCESNPGELLIEIEEEWTREHIQLLNAFTHRFFQRHSRDLDKYEQSADKNKFWMDFVTKNYADFGDIFSNIHKDDLISAGNVADYFQMPAFIHLFGYEMAKRTQNMNLFQLREFLNEENDFSTNEKRFIRSLGL